MISHRDVQVNTYEGIYFTQMMWGNQTVKIAQVYVWSEEMSSWFVNGDKLVSLQHEEVATRLERIYTFICYLRLTKSGKGGQRHIDTGLDSDSPGGCA